jgi:hypothetical protein
VEGVLGNLVVLLAIFVVVYNELVSIPDFVISNNNQTSDKHNNNNNNDNNNNNYYDA